MAKANSASKKTKASIAWLFGRSNWLFAGSLRAGQCTAAIMSMLQSARLTGHDPFAYLCNDELLPHRWQPAFTATETAAVIGEENAFRAHGERG